MENTQVITSNNQLITLEIPDENIQDIEQQTIKDTLPSKNSDIKQEPTEHNLETADNHIHEFRLVDPDDILKTYCKCGEWIEKHAGGRPCEYCKNKEAKQKIADDYLRKCRIKDGAKRTYPSIADLADLLNCDRRRLEEWATKKKPEGELEHPEFHDTMLLVKNLQYSYLEQRTLGKFNPTGAMFLLRVNHGAIETSKQIQAGLQNEPLQIEFIAEKLTS